MPTIPFPPGSLVAAYFRDSGGDTQDLSVPQQDRAFREWCALNNLVPGAVFQDIARPGSSVVGRDGFHTMIRYFRSGQIPELGLVIWSYSRFARDFDDAQFYRADIRRRGLVFYSLTDSDSIPDGPMGRLFEAAIDWKNEQFLDELSRNVKRGLYDLVRQYGAMPGTPPRGFLRLPITIGQRRDGTPHIVHRWAPDPVLTPRIQQAFAMRAARQPLLEIHRTTHIYSSLNSYQTFYTNKLYLGILEFGPVTIDDYCAPLIDRPTWDAVQGIIQEYSARYNLHRHPQNGNPHHPRRINSRYLLSGLLYCARCGSPLFGASTHTAKNKLSERYACTRAYRRHDCDLPTIPQKVSETAVLDQVRNHILAPETIAANQLVIQAGQTQAQTVLNQQRADLQTQLASVRRRSANLANAIAENGHTRALLEKLAAIEVDETALLSQLAALNRQAAAPLQLLTLDQIHAASAALLEQLQSGDLAARQRILRGMINRIVIDRSDRAVIGQIDYYLPPLNQFVTMSLSPLGAQVERV